MKVWTNGSGTTTIYYVYDALGHLTAEYSTGAPENPGMPYSFADMLGSVRAVTSDSGDVVEYNDYLPFGRMLSSLDDGRDIGYFQADPDNQIDSDLPQKFTGKKRDAVTGFDYFGQGTYQQRLAGLRVRIVHKIRDLSVGRSGYSMADFVEDVKGSCAREGVLFDNNVFNELVGL
jgi:hypothetical protein